MQLRSCRQLHFILAVKQGEVSKVPNVAQGKPLLKFKSLQEIYDATAPANDASPAKSGAKAHRGRGVRQAKVQVKVHPKEEENAAGNDCTDAALNRRSIIDQSHSKLGDIKSGEITLKQLKEECRAMKRKVSSSVKPGKGKSESSSPVKQECFKEEPTEDVLDLDETLISWKRRKLASASPGGISEVSIADEIQRDQDMEPCIGDIAMPISTKLELPVTHCMTSQESPLPYDDSSSDGYPAISSEITESGLTDTADGLSPDQNLIPVEAFPCFSLVEDCHAARETGNACSSNSDSSFPEESHANTLNQLSYGYLEHTSHSLRGSNITEMIAIHNLVEMESLQESQQEDMPDRMSSEESANGGHAEKGNVCFPSPLLIPEESYSCELNQVSYDHPQHGHVSLHTPGDPNIVEIVAINNRTAMESPQRVDIPGRMSNEGAAEAGDTCFQNLELFILEDSPAREFNRVSYHHLEDKQESSDRNRSPEAESSCLVGGEVCRSIDGNEEVVLFDLSSDVGSQVSSCDLTESLSELSSAVDKVDPSDYNTPTTMEITSLPYDNQTAPGNCSPDCHPGEAIEEAATSAAEGSCDDVELQCAPKRFFSCRKMITPTSQEKLCRLMNSIGLQDEAEAHACKEQLLVDKQGESTVWLSMPELGRDEVIPTAKTECTSMAEITSNSVKAKEVKDSKKFSRSRSTTRSPQTPQGSPRFSSGCNSIQHCSRSAIAFSQQQMHDIERLATKLTTELHTMKDILVEALQQESRTTTIARYNTKEVRIAVHHATKLEETSKKWLSIMTRDCNRFCKIMSLADQNADGTSHGDTTPTEKGENVTVGSSNTVQKKRKISFADEAGGPLCNVRLYENGPSSHLNIQLKAEEM